MESPGREWQGQETAAFERQDDPPLRMNLQAHPQWAARLVWSTEDAEKLTCSPLLYLWLTKQEFVARIRE